MKGKEVHWYPGLDHAGIATQVVVEKELKASSNQNRYDLGRSAFEKKIWEWKELYGERILTQLHRLGCSLDWSKLTFTLDEPRSEATREAFVRLYEDGLIYRDYRMVHWCPHLRSVLSDIEVDLE